MTTVQSAQKSLEIEDQAKEDKSLNYSCQTFLITETAAFLLQKFQQLKFLQNFFHVTDLKPYTVLLD